MSNVFRANAQAMPIDRRAALSGLVALGAAFAAPHAAKAALPALPAADPVFAAIERHRAALARLNFTCGLTDDVAAEQEGRTITADDEAQHAAADDDEAEAFSGLLSTAPQTKGGARELIEYVATLDDLKGVEEALPAFLATLLRSPLIAGEA
jgi:hypothetical protein